MFNKMLDWAGEYEYVDYCNKINKEFLWSTNEGVGGAVSADAVTRNSQSDRDVDYAFDVDKNKKDGIVKDKERIDQAAQYIAVLKEWANQIVRNDGGANSERYDKVIMIARMIYCCAGKGSTAREITLNSNYWTNNQVWNGATLKERLRDNSNLAISWTSLDPKRNLLVFDPNNDRGRQVYYDGDNVGKQTSSSSVKGGDHGNVSMDTKAELKDKTGKANVYVGPEPGESV
jgi:hypothetical protein